jgi:hypothetical protein
MAAPSAVTAIDAFSAVEKLRSSRQSSSWKA